MICGSGAQDTLPMTAVLAVGFGAVLVICGGKTIYSERDRLAERLPLWTAQDAEAAAQKTPRRDWRITFLAPMYEAEYQRQGAAHWVLVRKGPGFA